MRSPFSNLLHARWPWLAMAAVVCLASTVVMVGLQTRENNARASETLAREFSRQLAAPDAELEPLAAVLLREEPEMLRGLLRNTTKRLLGQLGPIAEIDPRGAAEIREAMESVNRQEDVMNSGAAFVRAARTADRVAQRQRDRAERAERDSLAGNLGALTFATLMVALLLSRERRLTLRAAQRHAAEVQHLADHDGLTGLLNRRRFDEDLATLAASDPSAAVEIVICDVNGLKAINDRLGHHAGDAVLQTATQDLRSALGGAATIYRTGGDEFSILSAPGERIADLARSAFERDGGVIVASVGAASWPADSPQPREVHRIADNRMYAAKRAIAAGKGASAPTTT